MIGAILSKFSACLPVSYSYSGVVPVEYIESSMEELIEKYEGKIAEHRKKSESLINQVIVLRRKGKKNEALSLFKKAKLESQKAENAEKLKDSLSKQLELRDTIETSVTTTKAMEAHKNYMKHAFKDGFTISAVGDLMDDMGEINREALDIEEAMTKGMIVDDATLEFDDFELMNELDAIAFSEGENISIAPEYDEIRHVDSGFGSTLKISKGKLPPIEIREVSEVPQRYKGNKRGSKSKRERRRKQETVADVLDI